MILRIRPESLLGRIEETDASTVVVYDKFRNPVLIVEQMADNTLLITPCDDDTFQDRLRLSGFVKEKAPLVVKK